MQIRSFVGYEVYVRRESGVVKLQGRIFSSECHGLREKKTKKLRDYRRPIPFSFIFLSAFEGRHKPQQILIQRQHKANTIYNKILKTA